MVTDKWVKVVHILKMAFILGIEYELEVDTFINSPEENAILIIKFIEGKRNKENVFKKLYDKAQARSCETQH